ncbi:TIGR00730 family Rossman fold protein [Commensalibacter melissae]|uniref:Cytokinin riboside 5'-monophosphate phosphoribohydrolase n=1 Tax=Commensalibacter melissae TaxID=2070537 RepID=A0A318N5Q0_9PROT|nr:TIGR00730 family Rossman fold protein [Commensalibacter melissae]PXZ00138.1 TIGR00730 family Rossman fold protein [Commensalibacter melissae]QGT69193.1 TIGR00730 family Rossman fold protein [Commensalibacter melissae]
MTHYNYSITVFCGSKCGNKSIYIQAAKELASHFVHNQLRLVFGGGSVGLMGIISNTMIDLGGSVKGIIPQFLIKKEGQHSRVNDLTVTEDMHSRKKILYDEGDAYLIMPGSIGTFDEFFEILTWRYLKLHNKPIIIVNVDNWARGIHDQLNNTIKQGFADKSLLKLFEVVPDVPSAIESLKKQMKF